MSEINVENSEFKKLKSTVSSYIKTFSTEFRKDIENDIDNWNIFNRKYDNKKFKYLTSVDGLTYPSKFRNVGEELIRSKINVLESKQQRREFRFKAVAIDERSLKEKIQNKLRTYMKTTIQMYEERSEFIKFQISTIQDKLGDLEQQLQIQPENEEMAAQLEQLKQNYPMIKFEMDKMIRMLSKQELDTNEFKEKFEYNMRFTETEIIEQLSNASLKSAIQTDELIEHWFMGFRERAVTGKPTYLTYFDTNKQKAVFRQVDSKNVFYTKGGNNKWTHEGEACALREFMDYNQMCSEFELTDTEREILKYKVNSDYTSLKNYTGNTAIFDVDNSHNYDKTEVWRVWFNVAREEWVSETPNKKRPNENFYHVVSADYKPRKGEKKTRIVLYDQYYCVVLAGCVFVNMGANNAVFRPEDRPSCPMLPIVARTFNRISDKPNGLIDRVKSLAELYNIINYKEEMTIALAGVKGMIMDKSQKPESMSVDKWTYYRRMGTMWIETIKKGRKIPASFNQFQSYDDGLSQSIQWYEVVKQNIEVLIGRIMGISPSLEGQFVSKDPVSNVKMSNEQSSLITEILYYENDQVFGKALELFLNLKCQYEWNKGKVINFLDPDLEETLISIPNGLLNKSNFRMYLSNNIKQDSLLEDVRNIAVQSWGRQEIPLQSLINIFSIDDLKQMEAKLTQYSEEAMKIKQMNAMQLDNNKAEADMRTKEFAGKIDMEIEQFRSQMDMARLELDKAIFEFDQQKFLSETQIKEKELEMKTNLDMLKISSENDIESSYLQEEGRANRVNEMLKSFELKINAMLQQMGIEAGDIANRRKSVVDMNKNMRNKENIKD